MPKPPRALVALGEVASQLVRSSKSGTVALARLADVLPAEVIPEEARGDVVARLEEAREQATEPIAFKQVEKTLKSAWGSAPAKVLDDIEREPLAVRAGGQVHAAEHDGREVVVKVLRPGLASAVRNDLAAIDVLAGPLNALFPGTDVGGMLRLAREMAQEEVDLEHEANQQRQSRRALRGLDDVVVPESITELAGTEVMVSERLHGPTLRDARPQDPGAVAHTVLRAHLTAWRGGGLALTDPRPGHVVLLDDGRVGLLGTGVARKADPARAGAVLQALAALRDDDEDGFQDAALSLGVLRDDDAAAAYEFSAYALDGLLDGPATLDEAALGRAAARTLRRLDVFLALASRATPDPEDLAPARMIGQLVALLGRIGAEHDWGELAR